MKEGTSLGKYILGSLKLGLRTFITVLAVEFVISLFSNIVNGTLNDEFTWYIVFAGTQEGSEGFLLFFIIPLSLGIVAFLIWLIVGVLMFFVGKDSVNRINEQKAQGNDIDSAVAQVKSLKAGELFKGYEFNYIENLEAAEQFRQLGKLNATLYDRVVSSFTLYYDDGIYLNNYKKEGKYISYAQLANCAREGNFKHNKKRQIVTIKIDGAKYDMFVWASDSNDRNNEKIIAGQLWNHINEKCGAKVMC